MLNKLKEILKNCRPPSLPQDKANHWIWTPFIMLPILPFSVWAAYACGILLAVGWEFYQKKYNAGKFEWLDALAGSAGCTFALIVSTLGG